jgi:hypothetical protein
VTSLARDKTLSRDDLQATESSVGVWATCDQTLERTQRLPSEPTNGSFWMERYLVLLATN